MKQAKPRGFTLIELMIVVAIVAILAMVALPSYLDTLQKGRRADAMAALLKVQLALEKYRATHTGFASLSTLGLGTRSPDGHYQLEMSSSSSSTYRVTATPVTGGKQAGDPCGTFAVNQDGPDYSGSYADARCWNR